jgi:hypothetical protein
VEGLMLCDAGTVLCAAIAVLYDAANVLPLYALPLRVLQYSSIRCMMLCVPLLFAIRQGQDRDTGRKFAFFFHFLLFVMCCESAPLLCPVILVV